MSKIIKALRSVEECDCLNKLSEIYEKELGPIEYINCATFYDTKTGKQTLRPPPLRFRFYAKGKDGKFLKRTKQSYFTQNYCQFCGKPYR